MSDRIARLLVCLCALMCALSLLASRNEQPLGEILAVRPDVRIQRGTELLPARKADAVYVRDMVRTNASGRIRMRLSDQSVISLGSDSEIRLKKPTATNGHSNLQMVYGLIRMQVAKLTADAGRFELRTPVAVAGVIGTDFGADASDPNVTKFVCIGGTVEIRNADPSVKGSVLCEGGHTTQVRVGQPPETPVPITDAQTERWQHITNPDEK